MAEKRLLDLCAMQLKLDASIQEKKKPELSKEALFDNTLVALDVELAEFANEGRWFKFWSEDQQPRTKAFRQWTYPQDENDAFLCSNCQREFTKSQTVKNNYSCPEDGGEITAWKTANPLLEEYVDCLHFFLSAANQKDWHRDLVILAWKSDKEFNGAPFVINHTYLRLKSHLANVYLQRERIHFAAAWESFLIIGIRIFGFSWDEIEAAYRAKNEVNHSRQESGY